MTKAYPAEIYKQYGYSFRFVDTARSLVNIVVSPEQITAISGLEIKFATNKSVNVNSPNSDKQHQDYR